MKLQVERDANGRIFLDPNAREDVVFSVEGQPDEIVSLRDFGDKPLHEVVPIEVVDGRLADALDEAERQARAAFLPGDVFEIRGATALHRTSTSRHYGLAGTPESERMLAEDRAQAFEPVIEVVWYVTKAMQSKPLTGRLAVPETPWLCGYLFFGRLAA